jgi:Ti-type conjugative transfer relaxase TraA
MAIYHFSVKMIGRSKGRNAVAAAAYRSASRLHDFRQDLSFDYSDKPDVIHSEIIAPDCAPKWVHGRELLWNAVEARETRRNAQLAREVEFALPEEMTQSEGIALARDFVQHDFVARGMVADLNLHWDRGNPHAHVMLTTRELNPDGFGYKVTDWETVEVLREWRKHWADVANEHLLRAGIDARIDHRSYRDQGVELEPTIHLGPAAKEMRARGEHPDRFRQLQEVRERNAQKIQRCPEIIFDNLTRRQSTFSREDVAREVSRYLDDGERFRALMARLQGSPELVMLMPETKQDTQSIETARYTTRAMLRIEDKRRRLPHTFGDQWQQQKARQTPALTTLPNESELNSIERFKEAKREFIKVAGTFDLDPKAKARASQLRHEMKQAAEQIAKDPAGMREAKRAGIAIQVKSLARPIQSERGFQKETDFGLEI